MQKSDVHFSSLLYCSSLLIAITDQIHCTNHYEVQCFQPAEHSLPDYGIQALPWFSHQEKPTGPYSIQDHLCTVHPLNWRYTAYGAFTRTSPFPTVLLPHTSSNKNCLEVLLKTETSLELRVHERAVPSILTAAFLVLLSAQRNQWPDLTQWACADLPKICHPSAPSSTEYRMALVAALRNALKACGFVHLDSDTLLEWGAPCFHFLFL